MKADRYLLYKNQIKSDGGGRRGVLTDLKLKGARKRVKSGTCRVRSAERDGREKGENGRSCISVHRAVQFLVVLLFSLVLARAVGCGMGCGASGVGVWWGGGSGGVAVAGIMLT